MKYIIYLLTFLSLIGCESEERKPIFNLFLNQDRTLPKLVEMKAIDMYSVNLLFDESIKVLKAELESKKCKVDYKTSCEVVLTFSDKLSLRDEKELYLVVRDYNNNTSSFKLSVCGLNPNIPTIKITELSAKGTTTQPDRVEMQVYQDGSLEGLVVSDGALGYENHHYIFDSLNVSSGDYIVIYWSQAPDISTYKNKSETTTHIVFANSETPLSSNNGCFIIYDCISGESNILDALIYVDNEASTYSGFGSKKLEYTYNTLQNNYEWLGPAFDGKYTTSTRTICRYNGIRDSNTKDDFFICDTKCISFGEINSNQIYIPK